MTACREDRDLEWFLDRTPDASGVDMRSLVPGDFGRLSVEAMIANSVDPESSHDAGEEAS